MSKNVQRRRGGPSALGGLGDDHDDGLSAGEVADSIFGSSKTSKSIRAKPTDITKIQPDPLQPRRAVPSELRAVWKGDPTRVQDMFDEWISRIEAENDRSLIWKDILEGSDSSRGAEAEKLRGDKNPADALEDLVDPLVNPLETSFFRLVDLAASIKRDGLTNPITVATADKDSFIIETGERRWLAYHLLKLVYGEEEWGDIPARQVREISVWRQASENNARSDLNAISKARQLALLLMALHDETNFKPMEEFEHEQEFYAQVGDGNKWRVPKNFGEQLLNAMGLSSASHLRRYRAILRVDPSIWDAADDGDWTEREIRDKWKIQQERAKKRDRGHGDDGTQPAPPRDLLQEERKYYARRVSEIARVTQKATVGEVSNSERVDTIKKIDEIRRWLKEQEELIKNK